MSLVDADLNWTVGAVVVERTSFFCTGEGRECGGCGTAADGTGVIDILSQGIVC